MSGVTTIDFGHPDETRTFTHGRVDIVRVGPSTLSADRTATLKDAVPCPENWAPCAG